MAGQVHTASAATRAHEAVDLGVPVGAVAPRRSGGWVAAIERGFVLFDERWASTGPVLAAPEQPDGTRFNDGKCDPAGRFWAGTLAYDGTPGACALYRLDAHGTVVRMLTGVTISNGLAWARAGDVMYYVDTGRGIIDVLASELESGTVTGRRTLVSIPPAEGSPDGMTLDSEGYLWVALWDGGCVRRYSPTGAVDRVLRLPVDRVTSVTFGGSDLDQLFITTAREGLGAEQREAQPLAGSVFCHRPGVTGLPPDAFAG